MASPPNRDPLVGQAISRYRITEKLGEGGMGVVYRARDTRLDRSVALKFLPPEMTRDYEAKARFVHEAKAAAALAHPNICTIHEIDEAEERLFIAMECIEGQSLKEKLAEGPMELDEVIGIAIQVAEGLQEAHEKGIVHRDIKPANVMVTDEGRVKIMDFGLATSDVATKVTKTGTTLGTVAYMSPEQARGMEVDHRTDIWSLGVVLYEMITGQLPFKGDREQAVLYSILHEDPKPLRDVRKGVPPELEHIVMRALARDPGARYSDVGRLLKDLMEHRSRLAAPVPPTTGIAHLLQSFWRPSVAIPTVLILLVLGVVLAWQIRRAAKIRWAREVAVPEIERLAEQARLEGSWDGRLTAFALAKQAARYVPTDSTFLAAWDNCSSRITVLTEPVGANVFVKEYRALHSSWEFIGVTPLNRIRLPFAFLRWRIEKEGYDTIVAVAPSFADTLFRVLDRSGATPVGMVHVPRQIWGDNGYLPEFFIDRFEVTNEEYKDFVESGGYQKQEYWRHDFVKAGRVLTWEEAMAAFKDATGRSGPSTWRAGDYPDGQANYPVSGVSWYEAAAYAAFVGKDLPTTPHWGMAAGIGSEYRYFSHLLIPASNFGDSGLAPVGTHQGVTAHGAYDMAGNVREWCWEETPKGRCTRGGAWDDVHYMYGNVSQQPAFSRSPKNGFRCVIYRNVDSIPALAWEPYEEPERDYHTESPVADAIFHVYRNQFSYDRGELDPTVESRDESPEDWIEEKISFAAAYGNERMLIYLYLPKRGLPPYQAVICFPGSNAISTRSSENLAGRYLDFFLKNGRAVVYPIYRGTYERNIDGLTLAIHWPAEEHRHAYTEYLIKWVKDFRRTIDYLETRTDIDHEKLAYYGFSWGGRLGGVIPALEDRLKASILVLGGLGGPGGNSRALPEVDEFNYCPRVKVPTLMLNGKYDMVFGYENSVKPMFDLLGVPEEDKRLVLYEADHFIPLNGLIQQSLDWLDRYLGPVPR